MTNDALRIKVRERFNKLSSQDYENLEDWQILEAFDKAQVTWVRQQLAGKNPRQEVDESTKQVTDDLSPILQTFPLVVLLVEDGLYAEAPLPDDYLGFKRVSASAKNECCPPRRLKIEHCEVANVDDYLRDTTHCPSFEWGETFYTLENQRIQVYVNKQFELVLPRLVYYQRPPHPEIVDVLNLSTGQISTQDVPPIFSDSVCELLLEKTAQILAGDMENTTQYQRASAEVAASS